MLQITFFLNTQHFKMWRSIKASTIKYQVCVVLKLCNYHINFLNALLLFLPLAPWIGETWFIAGDIFVENFWGYKFCAVVFKKNVKNLQLSPSVSIFAHTVQMGTFRILFKTHETLYKNSVRQLEIFLILWAFFPGPQGQGPHFKFLTLIKNHIENRNI